MHIPATRGYDADLAAVAAITEVDQAAIIGWALTVWGPGGVVRLTHNGCCTEHVRGQLIWLMANMPAELVPCSAEQ